MLCTAIGPLPVKRRCKLLVLLSQDLQTIFGDNNSQVMEQNLDNTDI
jgi:hypothetical protein